MKTKIILSAALIICLLSACGQADTAFREEIVPDFISTLTAYGITAESMSEICGCAQSYMDNPTEEELSVLNASIAALQAETEKPPSSSVDESLEKIMAKLGISYEDYITVAPTYTALTAGFDDWDAFIDYVKKGDTESAQIVLRAKELDQESFRLTAAYGAMDVFADVSEENNRYISQQVMELTAFTNGLSWHNDHDEIEAEIEEFYAQYDAFANEYQRYINSKENEKFAAKQNSLTN